MRDNKSDLLLRECVFVCVFRCRCLLESLCECVWGHVSLAFALVWYSLSSLYICQLSWRSLTSTCARVPPLWMLFNGWKLLLSSFCCYFSSKVWKNKDNLRTLEFRDQFSVLTSCLLACILLAYWLLIKHIYASLILHVHILDPLTTLLNISSN